MANVYGYPKGWELKWITDQIMILQRLFPCLDASERIVQTARYQTGKLEMVLPEGSNGLAVFPKHSVLARYLKANEKWPVYNRALAHVLATMKTVRPDFVDLTNGKHGPEYERMTSTTQEVFDDLEKLPGDIIVLAVQTGILHRDESVQSVRASFDGQEFGLDSVSAGSILLVHPERLQKSEHLAIDCPGSERSPEADGQFVRATCFDFLDSRLKFDAFVLENASPVYGSTSAFLPALGVKS